MVTCGTHSSGVRISFSPRSGRQHKAWGVSPRIASRKGIKAREAGGRVGTHASGVRRMAPQ